MAAGMSDSFIDLLLNSVEAAERSPAQDGVLINQREQDKLNMMNRLLRSKGPISGQHAMDILFSAPTDTAGQAINRAAAGRTETHGKPKVPFGGSKKLHKGGFGKKSQKSEVKATDPATARELLAFELLKGVTDEVLSTGDLADPLPAAIRSGARGGEIAAASGTSAPRSLISAAAASRPKSAEDMIMGLTGLSLKGGGLLSSLLRNQNRGKGKGSAKGTSVLDKLRISKERSKLEKERQEAIEDSLFAQAQRLANLRIKAKGLEASQLQPLTMKIFKMLENRRKRR